VLLGRPGQEVHVLDLVEGSGGPSRAETGTDTGPMIDAAARSAYRRRLVDLEEEIDEASRDHDQGRLEKLGAEKDFLAAELSAALGLGGRVRVTGDPDRAGPAGGGRADRDRLEGHRDRASGIGPASAEQRLDWTVLQLPAGPSADLAADRHHLTSPCRMWRLPNERDGPAPEGGKAMSTITDVETTPQAIEELAGRIFMEGVGAFHLGTVYIGLKHGPFAALVEDGPLTAGELAMRTGLDGWYVREWLQAETTAGLLLADDDDLTTASFTAAPGVREALVDETDPAFIGGLPLATAAGF
jgi:hypothetical protein